MSDFKFFCIAGDCLGGDIMTTIIAKMLLPVISFAVTELIKYLWERYLVSWPTSVSVSMASGVGALLTQITPLFGNDPIVGALLGALASVVHDIGLGKVTKGIS